MALPRQAPPNSAAMAAVAVQAGTVRRALLMSAAAMVLALWASDARSQEAAGQTPEQAQPSGDTAPAESEAPDALLATVGGSEIRSSDLLRAIGTLPPPVSAQPPEMLATFALEQLLLREAIVQEARAQGLAEDAEVRSLVAEATRNAEEDALVQVWLEQELGRRVPPEAVDQAYAGLQAIATGEVPPLERIRPQIEQRLRQQAIADLRASLLAEADITLFGPDGQPREGGAAGGEPAGQAPAQDSGAAGQEGAGSQPPQGEDAPATDGDAGAEPGQPAAGGASEQPATAGD